MYDFIGGKNMNKELIIIILAPIIIFSFMWYQDKRRKQRELSDKLNNSVVNLNRGKK